MVIGLGIAALALIVLASPANRALYPGWLAAPRGLTKPAALVEDMTPRSAGGPGWDRVGALTIPVADPVPPRVPAPGVPAHWHLHAFAGDPVVEIVRSEIGLALRLRSQAASFALSRGVVVDLEELPVLSWAWRVNALPVRADVRQRATDDQAAQVYVVFPRWPGPRTSSDVIGYVWDTSAPAGTELTSPKAANVRVVVVESGPDRLGLWRRYRRNVRDDYVALFGRRPPRVGSVAVMIDAEDTGGSAEALVGDLVFSRS